MVWPGIKMIQTEYRLVSVGVSVGPAYVPLKTCKRFKHAWAVWRHPKRHIKKKESETLSETDGLCSSEHGLWWITGYRFWGVPYRLCRFQSCFKVQGNFLLLCSSNNFVGYSYIYISWIYHPNRMDQKQSPTSTRAFISRESQAKPLFATSQLGYLPIPISISHGLAFSANIPGKLSRIKITTSIPDWTLPFGHHPSEIDTFQLISCWIHVPLLKVDRQTGFIILHLGF